MLLTWRLWSHRGALQKEHEELELARARLEEKQAVVEELQSKLMEEVQGLKSTQVCEWISLISRRQHGLYRRADGHGERGSGFMLARCFDLRNVKEKTASQENSAAGLWLKPVLYTVQHNDIVAQTVGSFGSPHTP